MLERDVEEGGAGFGQDLVAVAELRLEMDAPALALGHPRGEGEATVDERGTAVAHEHARRHSREAIPGGEQATGLVESCADETAVDDAGAGLVARPERESRLVALESLVLRLGQVNAFRIFVPASPARRIVMGGDPLYRRPPRSKWAL